MSLLFPDNTIYDLRMTEPPPIYEAQPEPQIGVRATPGDLFVGVIHDDLDDALHEEIGRVGARTLTDKLWKLHQTNEIRVMRMWTGDKVRRVPAKYSYWPEHYGQAWVDHFYSQMTPVQRANIEGHNFGWRDGNAGQLNPMQHLVCGGQLLRVLGRWFEFYLVECQDVEVSPVASDYLSAPHLWVKQGICGHNKVTKESYYGKVNPNQGNLFIVNACPGGIAAIPYWEIREYPQAPFDTIIDGYPARVVELHFRGSEILGKLDSGIWVFLLEQVTRNGNQRDFIVHAPEFGQTLPVPMVDYQKS